eukprot:jgi/Hompol1/3661/HPOL_006679-RA
MGHAASVPLQPISPSVPLRVCTTFVGEQGKHIVFRKMTDIPSGGTMTQIFDLSSGNPNAVVFTTKQMSSQPDHKHNTINDASGTPLVSVKQTNPHGTEWSLLQGNNGPEIGRITQKHEWKGITLSITIVNQNDGVSLVVTLRLRMPTMLQGTVYLGDPDNGGMPIANIISSRNMGLQKGMFAADSLRDCCITVAGGVDIGFVFAMVEIARETVIMIRERD